MILHKLQAQEVSYLPHINDYFSIQVVFELRTHEIFPLNVKVLN